MSLGPNYVRNIEDIKLDNRCQSAKYTTHFGLWNVEHVTNRYDSEFLDMLKENVATWAESRFEAECWNEPLKRRWGG